MLKNALIFILGALFGGYVMRNYIFRKAIMTIINSNNERKKKESKTSQTENKS